MLKGISPLIRPDLLDTLYRMGHGDEIIFADAHFPGESLNTNVIRADGLLIADLLATILPLFELDSYVESPFIMMAAVETDHLDSKVEERYLTRMHLTNPNIAPIQRIDRFAFYDRAKTAFAVVMTGDTAKYGNVILKKGVALIEDTLR